MKTKRKTTFFRPSVLQPIKNLSWSQAKARFPGLKPYGDVDRDGVKNFRDCKPFDIRRQGEEHDEEFEEMEKTSAPQKFPLGRSMSDYSEYRARKKLKEFEDRNVGI